MVMVYVFPMGEGVGFVSICIASMAFLAVVRRISLCWAVIPDLELRGVMVVGFWRCCCFQIESA
jgi:hypothetical protein